MTKLSRRDLLAGLGSGTVMLGGGSLARLTAANSVAANSEYLFEPGMNYLNTAALGPTTRSVLDAVLKSWYELELNPVMMAYANGAVHVATDEARKQIGSLINCDADELLLARSATDAMNSIALGVALNQGDRVLTTSAEHEGGLNGWEYLKRRRGVEVDLVSIAPGDFDTKAIIGRFEMMITDRTKVIVVSHVISSTGLRLPVTELVALAKSRGILSVIDGAQAVGGIDVDVKRLGCDAYVGTGHKWLMGPKGTGFVYINKDKNSFIQPVQREDGMRFVVGSTGVGSLPLVVGLGAACEAMSKRGMALVEKRIIELRDRAYEGLTKISKIQIVSPPPGPLTSALVSYKLPDSIAGNVFREQLQKKYRIVLKVIPKKQFNGNRISPHIFNTEKDIDAVVRAIRTELS